MTSRPQILERASVVTDFTRCRLLAVLDEHELSVGDLCAVLQLPQSTVSRHLKVLTESDWVRSRREGTTHFYRRPGTATDEDALWSLLRSELGGDPVVRSDRARLSEVLRERRLRSQEFFSSTAGDWDDLRDQLFGARSDLVALLALLDADAVVGDLGCGTGRVTAALCPFVARVVAVDGSDDMLAAARERVRGCENADVRPGELEELPVADADLDVALAILSLHHAARPRAVVDEVFRVLRPGGRFLVVEMVPHDREEYRQRMGHQWLGFDPDQLRDLVERAGFVHPRVVRLPPDPGASGPALFTLTAERPSETSAPSPLPTSGNLPNER